MILQALYEYAQRASDILPAAGFEKKALKYLIQISQEGRFLGIQSLIQDKKGKIYEVPQSFSRSGSASYEKPFLFWDNMQFTLGKSDPKKIEELSEAKLANEQEKTAKKLQYFIKQIQELPDSVKQDVQVRAVLRFYTDNRAEGLDAVNCISEEEWKEIAKSNPNISFKVEGFSDIVPCCNAVREYQKLCIEDEFIGDDSEKQRCLITGKNESIARICTDTPIYQAKTTAKLVAFQKNQGYDSYGKNQGFNAPLSKRAESYFSRALKHLIQSENNHILIGGDTAIFWAERNDFLYEDTVLSIFRSAPKDNPDRNVLQFKAFLNSVYKGKQQNLSSKFYFLLLSPNSARISVRLWETGDIEVFARKIKTYFEELRIVNQKSCPSINEILWAVKPEGKDELPRNWVADFVRSIFRGSLYPKTLQQQCIRRIRADRKITATRCSFLKAYHNRYCSIYGGEEVPVALDRERKDVGYLSGRLFAVLEKIQADSYETKLNSTITDRYYGSASSNPVLVFPRLLKLSQYHLASNRIIKYRTVYEKEIEEIMSKIDQFPSHLTLNEQSLFAIGFYHEKQSLYTKKNKGEENE